MCKYCDDIKLSQCKVVVERKTGLRNVKDGKLEPVPCYSEILIPLNYCPTCGRKLGGTK